MGATGKVLQLGAEAALGAGKQFLKKMRKAKTLPKLSGIVTEDLTKHIDTLKPEDYAAEISNIETMFKGMVNKDGASYEAFDEFSSTKMVANKYQQNVSELERAYKPKTDAEKSLYVSKLDTPAEEGYKAADPEQFQQWTKREAEHFAEHGKASKERFICRTEYLTVEEVEGEYYYAESWAAAQILTHIEFGELRTLQQIVFAYREEDGPYVDHPLWH